MPSVDTTVAIRVYDCKNVPDVKNKLLKLYGNVEAVADGKSIELNNLVDCDVVEIAEQNDFDKNRYNAVDVQRVIDRLMRVPGGCPWDSVQTHESIRSNMVEEAYEAVDAIDTSDIAAMREEFGDVLLQSVLQSAIARRDNEFDFNDVCDELCKKLISRHTFLFGNDSAENSDDALSLWDKNKAKEKHYSSVKNQLQRLPNEFPSLLRCQKAYKKIKKSGGDLSSFNLDGAIENKDYAKAIAALCGMIASSGGDAEVELNGYVRKIIEDMLE